MQRALRVSGWTPEQRESAAEWLIYVHPDRPGAKVPVNPSWERIYVGDPVFDCLKRDMGIDRSRLRELLGPPDH